MRGVRRHLSLMRHTLSLSFAKNALWVLFVALLAIGSSSCKDEKDEPDNPLEIENSNSQNLSVTINSDGTATNGAVFSRYNEEIFYLDYVAYMIYQSHLMIIGHDSYEFPATPKLYAEVTLNGTLYKTRELYTYYAAFGGFSGTNIISISIPNTVQRIIGDFFRNCSSLTSISLPNELKFIDSNCFEGCTSLAKITFNSDIPENTYNWHGLYSIISKPVAYVPKEFLTNYQQSKFAKYFSEIIGY